jgi:hypothetical protein
MFYRAWLVAVVLGLAVGLPGWCEAPGEKKAGDVRVGRLIAQLGSRKFPERQKATRTLDQLGKAALPELARAAQSSDPEVARRCRELVKVIERRLEMEKLLAPTGVHLVYKDKPLTEAVADLAKKTGFFIDLEGDKAKLASRKITLDTGKTTFWQAFDAFCQKAQLAERGLVLAADKKVPVSKNASSGYWSGYGTGFGPQTYKKETRLVLLDSRVRALPTQYVHGVRFRALPPTTPLEGMVVAPGSKVFVLEAALEPRTRLRKVIGLRVRGAVDEKGKQVSASPELLVDQDDSSPYMYNPYNTTVPAYQSRLQNGMDEGNFRRIPVVVKARKTVKEIRGVLIAEVQKPASALCTVENVLKAAGKSFDIPGGSTMTVAEVNQKKDGQVNFKLSTSFSLGRMVMAIQMGNGVVRVRRNQGGDWETVGLEPSNLKLLDAKGRGIRQAGVRQLGSSFAGRGINQDMVLTYQPEKGQVPAKLVYYGVGTTLLEIPFTLTNIPLP